MTQGHCMETTVETKRQQEVHSFLFRALLGASPSLRPAGPLLSHPCTGGTGGAGKDAAGVSGAALAAEATAAARVGPAFFQP